MFILTDIANIYVLQSIFSPMQKVCKQIIDRKLETSQVLFVNTHNHLFQVKQRCINLFSICRFDRKLYIIILYDNFAYRPEHDP